MQERIVEIILYLVNELKSNKRLSDVDVSSLERDGYTPSEISSAFSWLFERLAVGQLVIAPTAGNINSHRLLNDAEKMIVSPQAAGYLMQCQQLGIISNADIEAIVERIMTAGFSSVGLTEMKSFVASYLFDIDGMNGQVAFGFNDTIH
ncbi:MAG TPA: DUF494 family protein [Bacteroidota bacterium]|nr:DUF494 family protein [Bacteroidota bacterium]